MSSEAPPWLLFRHFQDKVRAAVSFATSATDEALQMERSEVSETLTETMWWNVLQLDESFRLGSHLQLFERLASCNWPSIASVFVAGLKEFRHDDTYFRLASPRRQAVDLASMVLHVRVFSALLSRFGIETLSRAKRLSLIHI